jgi:hypothetical protein
MFTTGFDDSMKKAFNHIKTYIETRGLVNIADMFLNDH